MLDLKALVTGGMVTAALGADKDGKQRGDGQRGATHRAVRGVASCDDTQEVRCTAAIDIWNMEEQGAAEDGGGGGGG